MVASVTWLGLSVPSGGGRTYYVDGVASCTPYYADVAAAVMVDENLPSGSLSPVHRAGR